jgi:hypothetical protein
VPDHHDRPWVEPPRTGMLLHLGTDRGNRVSATLRDGSREGRACLEVPIPDTPGNARSCTRFGDPGGREREMLPVWRITPSRILATR